MTRFLDILTYLVSRWERRHLLFIISRNKNNYPVALRYTVREEPIICYFLSVIKSIEHMLFYNHLYIPQQLVILSDSI